MPALNRAQQTLLLSPPSTAVKGTSSAQRCLCWRGHLHPVLPLSALSLSSGTPPVCHLQPPQLQPLSALCKAGMRNLGCRGTAELSGAPLTLNDHSSFARSCMMAETSSSGTRRADVAQHQQH